ncbi:MarR family transcriptional regulator, partial [Candidatus Bathyarchaeota archaeon]
EVWVEYTLGQTSPIDWEAYLVPILLIVAVIMLAAGGTRLIRPRFATAEPPPPGRVLDEAKWEAIAPTLTERERMVLESIMREGGRVSQRKLRHICDLPKSTLSRVTDELQRKGLLRKIPVGQTNEIRLDDRLLK